MYNLIPVLHKGDDQAIVEGPKNNVEIPVTEEAYVEPLTPEEIRWFYKDGVDKRWNEFCGYDSLRIERIYRERQNLISENNDGTNGLPPAEKIVVRGGMYDVEIDNMKCVSIYWPGEYYVFYFSFILIVSFSIFLYCCTNYELQLLIGEVNANNSGSKVNAKLIRMNALIMI